MKVKQSDLIAIANSELADKLNKQAEKEARLAEGLEQHQDNANPKYRLDNDVWRALGTLNIIRYTLAMFLLLVVALEEFNPKLNQFVSFQYPTLFVVSSVILITSAIVFSYLVRRQAQNLDAILLAQFSLDTILAALLCHSAGGIESNFVLLYIMTVATGSIVLPRKQALALASGAVIAMFFEHVYSYLATGQDLQHHLLFRNGVLLFLIAWLLSYLAQRLRIAELATYTPGEEPMENYLDREEKKALTSALKMTNGNKTEAAKLLGMSFRSFRYKISKYKLD